MRPATAGLPRVVAERAESSIAFVKAGAPQLKALGTRGEQLAHAASQAFVDATGTAFGVAAGVLVVAAAVVAWRAPGVEELAVDPTDADLDGLTSHERVSE